jgi:dCMP deaminase
MMALSNELEKKMKRTDYISWDEYFMGIALLSAQRSKDSGTQVGACIVNTENKILSVGYNGMPIGCDDNVMPWKKEGDPLETKYIYVCHAELNAILNNDGGSLKGAKLYTTLFPCNECAKAIIQSGIKEVIYLSDKYANSDSVIASKKMFDMVGISYEKYESSGKTMKLEL